MKKTLLSTFIIASFVFYSFFQRRPDNVQTRVSPLPTPNPLPPETIQTNQPKTKYKDGEYIGNTEDAFYGNIQVKAIIKNGRITDIQFLQYPNDREESITINTQAMPILRRETIRAQNAKVDLVSGATDTSLAFIQSLSSALKKAI